MKRPQTTFTIWTGESGLPIGRVGFTDIAGLGNFPTLELEGAATRPPLQGATTFAPIEVREVPPAEHMRRWRERALGAQRRKKPR